MRDVVVERPVIKPLVEGITLAVAAFAVRPHNAQSFAPRIRIQNGKSLRVTAIETDLEAVVVRAERALGVVDLAELRVDAPRLDVADTGKRPAAGVDAGHKNAGIQLV